MKLFILLNLIPLVLLSASNYKYEILPEVIFDQSNEQIYSPFDTGFSGLSRFATLIREMNWTVSSNSRPLHQILPLLNSKEKILVLGVAIYRKYSQEDLRAIKDFIQTGGGVLVIVEHDDLFKNQTFQNELISQFGIRALPSQALGEGKKWEENIWPIGYSPVFNLNQIQTFLPAPLKLSKKVRPLLFLKKPRNKEENIVAAWAQYRKGNIIVLGDQEILWNMTSTSGVRKGQNKKFLTQILNILHSEKRPTSIPHKENFLTTGKNALFYTDSFSQGPEKSLSGLSSMADELRQMGYSIHSGGNGLNFTKFDLVIVAIPLTILKRPNELSKAKKLILITDGQSDILSKDEKLREIFEKSLGLKINFMEYDNPINSIIKNSGLEFFKGTLTAKGVNHFFVTSNKYPIFRSSFIKKINPNSQVKYLDYCDGDILPLFNVVPPSEDPKTGRPFEAFLGTEKLDRYPIMALSKNIMLISDLELVSNQFFSKENFKEIKNWLNNL
jgi:hypothetical protein